MDTEYSYISVGQHVFSGVELGNQASEDTYVDLQHVVDNVYEVASPLPLEGDVNPLKKEVWFHGRISRQTAEELLQDSKQPDCFLIRESTAHKGEHAISVKCDGKVRHFLIKKMPSGNFEALGARKEFDSITSLVKFYENNPLSPAGERLRVPLSLSRQENEVWHLLESHIFPCI